MAASSRLRQRIQANAQAHQGHAQRFVHPAWQFVGESARYSAAVVAHQRRQELLFLAGEAGHVRVLDQVARMQLVLAVRNAQAGFVKVCGPSQQLPVHGAQEHAVGDLVTGGQRRALDPLDLRRVDAVSRHEGFDCLVARVALFQPAEHVLQARLRAGQTAIP